MHVLTSPHEEHQRRRDDPKENTDDIRQDRNERKGEAGRDPRVFPHVAEDPDRVLERRAHGPRSHQ